MGNLRKLVKSGGQAGGKYGGQRAADLCLRSFLAARRADREAADARFDQGAGCVAFSDAGLDALHRVAEQVERRARIGLQDANQQVELELLGLIEHNVEQLANLSLAQLPAITGRAGNQKPFDARRQKSKVCGHSRAVNSAVWMVMG